MCLVVSAYGVWKGYSLVIAANRDEFFERPSKRAGFWQDAPDILAGRDLTSNGTWLGVTKQGKVSFVTNKRNFREPKISNPISRGSLVASYLKTSMSPEAYMAALSDIEKSYEGFNLFLADQSSAYYVGNRGGARQRIEKGFHTLSNADWNTKWPKTDRILSKFVKIANESEKSGTRFPIDSLFSILNDNAIASDTELPDTGIGLARERMLSSIRISLPGYGTRVSTVVAINEEGLCEFWEKTFQDPFATTGEILYFRLPIQKEIDYFETKNNLS